MSDLTADGKARLLLHDIQQALAEGTQHYRVSDEKLLTTPREIVEALRDEGSVRLQFPEGELNENHRSDQQ